MISKFTMIFNERFNVYLIQINRLIESIGIFEILHYLNCSIGSIIWSIQLHVEALKSLHNKINKPHVVLNTYATRKLKISLKRYKPPQNYKVLVKPAGDLEKILIQSTEEFIIKVDRRMSRGLCNPDKATTVNSLALKLCSKSSHAYTCNSTAYYQSKGELLRIVKFKMPQFRQISCTCHYFK